MGTYPSRNTQGFASLLDRIFLREHGGPEIKRVAPELDVSPSTLYAYCEGRLVCPPDLIASLFLATGDRRILDFFTSEAGVVWYALPAPSEEPCSNVLRQAIEAQEKVLEMLHEALAAFDDGEVTRAEALEIERAHYTAQAALARLLACVKAQARRVR